MKDYKYSIIGFLTIIPFMLGKVPESYEKIVILPIIFSVFSLSKSIHKLRNNMIGIRILYYIMFIKFVLGPFFTLITGNIGTRGTEPGVDAINKAFILQSIEITTIFIILIAVAIASTGKLAKRKVNRMEIKNIQPKSFNLLIIICLILIIIFPSLLKNFSFLKFEGYNTISFFRGLDIHFLEVGKLLILIYIIRKMSVKKFENNTYAYIVSLVSMGVYIGVIRGDNRLQIVFSIIICLVLSKIFYPNRFQKTVIFISFIGIGMLVAMSVHRIWSVTEWRPSGGTTVINLDYFSNFFQIYFSGIRNTAQGVEAMNIYNGMIGIDTLIADIFSWSGYIANFIVDILGEFSHTTNGLFNTYLYGTFNRYGDQILPSISQGYAYLSIYGAFLVPTIFTISILLVEKLNTKVTTIEEYILNIQLMSILSMFLGYSISSIGMYVFGTYFIWFIIFRVNNVVRRIRIRGEN